METKKQQLYEKKGLPEGFYPNNGITFNYDNIYDGVFTTTNTYEECVSAYKAGAIFTVIGTSNYTNHIATEIIYINRGDESDSVEAIVYYINDYSIEIFKFKYNKDNTKTIEPISVLNQDNLLKTYDLTDFIKAIIDKDYVTANKIIEETFKLNYRQFINKIQAYNVVITKNAGIKVITSNDNSNLNTATSLIWITGNGSTTNKIHLLSFNAINESAINTSKYDVIDTSDTTYYRTSNLNIDPITNPKIWVGTATQYAAIAQKDSNTTYIVKSDS